MTNLEFLLSKVECKANHEITCLNPTEWFIPKHIRTEDRAGVTLVWLRSDNTCWFRLDQMEIRSNQDSIGE